MKESRLIHIMPPHKEQRIITHERTGLAHSLAHHRKNRVAIQVIGAIRQDDANCARFLRHKLTRRRLRRIAMSSNDLPNAIPDLRTYTWLPIEYPRDC